MAVRVTTLAERRSNHGHIGRVNLSGSGGRGGQGLGAVNRGGVGLVVGVDQNNGFLLEVDHLLSDGSTDVGRARGGSRSRGRGGRWSRGKSRGRNRRRRGSGRGRGGSGGHGRSRGRGGAGGSGRRSRLRGGGGRRRRRRRRGAGLGSENVAKDSTDIERHSKRRGHTGGGRAGGRGSVGNGEGIFGTRLHGQAVGNTGGTGLDILVLDGRGDVKLALLLISITLDVEQIAVLDLARRVGALLDGGLQDILLPSVDEVTVVTIASRVTMGHDEVTLVVLEGSGVPNSFEEERNDAGLEAFGAGSVHDERGVGDVRGVVIGVDILAVPARWEHQLETDTIGAVGVQVVLVGQKVTAQRRFGLGLVVQAVEPKGLLLEGGLRTLFTGPLRLGGIRDGPGEVPLEGVTGNHAEALWESLDILTVQEVVTKNRIRRGVHGVG